MIFCKKTYFLVPIHLTLSCLLSSGCKIFSTNQSSSKQANTEDNVKIADVDQLISLNVKNTRIGTHIVVSDLHLDAGPYSAAKSTSQNDENLVWAAALKALVANRDISAVTVNGDVFQRQSLEKLTPVQRGDAFVNFYTETLKAFRSNANPIILYANVGDHDLAKILKTDASGQTEINETGKPASLKWANGDDQLNFRVRDAVLSNLVQAAAVGLDIQLLAGDPRKAFRYKPVLNSYDIAMTHIGYDSTDLIKQQVGPDAKFLKTLGKHSENMTFNTNNCNNKILKISSDSHFPYGDPTCGVWNSGTISAINSKTLRVPVTGLKIKGNTVTHIALFDTNKNVYIHCMEQFSEAAGQNLVLKDWVPNSLSTDRTNVPSVCIKK